jgi:hypothetical protein
VPSTVLIAFPEHLPTLHKGVLSAAIAFPPTDIIAALDVIQQQRPRLVVLERTFAASGLGAALIDRIRADPALHACEIRIVSQETDVAAVPLDFSGTRRAPRFNMIEGVSGQIDGNPVNVVNMSVVGALVVSSKWVRPNQRVRFTFVDHTGATVRLHSMIASAAMEIFEGESRYRTGIEFFDADEAALQRFIDAKKK